MSVASASRTPPLAATELAAADPGSVAVALPDFDDDLPPDAAPFWVAASLLLAAREPSTPPRTAARMMTRRMGMPIQSHLLRFFF